MGNDSSPEEILEYLMSDLGNLLLKMAAEVASEYLDARFLEGEKKSNGNIVKKLLCESLTIHEKLKLCLSYMRYNENMDEFHNVMKLLDQWPQRREDCSWKIQDS